MEAWKKSESEAAKLYGRKAPMSGAGVLSKMDIIGEGNFKGWRGENKFTEKDSFSVNAEIIKKAIKQARSMNAKPFWRIDLGSHNLKMIMIGETEWIRLHGEN